MIIRMFIIIAIAAGCFNSLTLAQQSKFDQVMPSINSVVLSLNALDTLLQKSDLTNKDFLQVFYAEKTVGRCIWWLSSRMTGDTELIRQRKMFGFLNDTLLMNKCIAYVSAHKDRLKVVDDGWKGEDNFYEPTNYWLLRALSKYPDSTQTKEIEFNLDFNELVRQYDIQDDFIGKTCEQCVKDELEMGGEELRKNYSEDDIKQWVPNCKGVRKQFEEQRAALLEKYHNAHFTKKLRDINITTIVVFHGTC